LLVCQYIIYNYTGITTVNDILSNSNFGLSPVYVKDVGQYTKYSGSLAVTEIPPINNALDAFFEGQFVTYSNQPNIIVQLFLILYFVLLVIISIIGYYKDKYDRKKYLEKSFNTNSTQINNLERYIKFFKTEHAWIGLFLTPGDNPFTRPQRTALLFTIIIMNLSISALWQKQISTIQQQILVGFISSMVITSVGFLIKLMFKNYRIQNKIPSKWIIIEAYISCCILIIPSVFIIYIYGIYFTIDDTIHWFNAYGFSVLFSIVIFEPISVTARFLFVSILLKRRQSKLKNSNQISTTYPPTSNFNTNYSNTQNYY